MGQLEVAASEPWRRNLGQSNMELTGARPASWWTGVAPEDVGCPGRDEQGHVHGLPQIDTCASREQVQAYFDNGWTLTEVLFAALRGEEAFYRPPAHGLRHPMIFYYVHPAALYINKLVVAKLLPQGLNADYEALFETGVDEMRWDDMAKNAMHWPAVEAAQAYRAHVYKTVSALIATTPALAAGHAPILADHPLWALFMGFEHERIHLETSSVLIRELPLNLVQRPQALPPLHPSAWNPSSEGPGAAERWLSVASTTVQLGKPQATSTFGWDNEYGRREVVVPAFEVAQNLVSNAEMLQFVRAGGYRDETLWTAEGWRWRSFRNSKAPSVWRPSGPQGSHQYKLRTLCEEIPMPWDWPAVLNAHEADAYATWRGQQALKAGETELCFRLPTEAEHHALRSLARVQEPNNQLRWSSESPVRGLGTGLGDLFGNVWQWLADDFHPLPEFRVHPYYEDFSTPCFDGEHRMIIGGSFCSLGDEASAWARFHFRPHFFQHAGCRLVRAPAPGRGAVVKLQKAAEMSSYESESMLNEYMLLHYGEAQQQMPYAFGPQGAGAFPQRCADFGIGWARQLGLELNRALDLGCAVGAATFRLAEAVSEEALGLDLSERFIAAATVLQQSGELAYFCKDEGELGQTVRAKVSPLARSRAVFRRADACALPPDLGAFDLVLLANLLCRLPSPRACLARLGGARGLVRPGGLLVMTTPFTWVPAYTPKESWLGGREVNGESSEEALLRFLAPDFTLLERRELPLVIREHRRKFQYIVPAAFVLRRHS